MNPRAWLIVAAALAMAGCSGTGGGHTPSESGSTLVSTWGDPQGTGELVRGPGEPLIPRTALAPASPAAATLATFAQITDEHVTDEESPARLEMLDRFGGSFSSAFRPQESLSTQVLAAIVSSVDAAHPGAVFETGDLVDNDQQNELTQAFSVLRGGRVDPNSGAPGYAGVQSPSNADPLIYRPGLDAPTYPGLLTAAERPFRSAGLRAPWYPLPGNHDLLVQGLLRATPATNAVAVGSRKLVTLDPAALRFAGRRRLRPAVIAALLRHGLPGRSITVPADPARREVPEPQVIAELRKASGHGGTGALMDEVVPLGRRAEAIMLDTTDRTGGDVGVIHAGQLGWLRRALARAGSRWVVVFSGAPLADVTGGGAALALLDGDRRMVASIAGDVHRNSITARPTRAGGYWLITTSSLADYPQQARAFRLVETAGGGVVLDTWMLDGDPRSRLADISRELAYLDAQGGRPRHLAGRPRDRNARLYRPPPPGA